MDGPLYIGTVTVRPDLSLPIVDCKGWYVVGKEARCRKGLDVSGCPSCPQRVSREGDLRNPPVYGRGDAPPARLAPVPPSAQPAPPERIRGLGDVVAKVTKAVGIKPCGPCQKRREALNRMVPFNGKPPADASLPEGTAGGERAGEAT